MRNRAVFAVVLCVTLWAKVPMAQVNVSVDPSQTGITIDGFGGFGGMMPWWFPGPHYNEDFLDLLLDTLGLTILRTEPYPIPDQEAKWTQQIPYLQALKGAADERGIDLKVLGSVWTPPASMKDNNSTVGGHLNPSEYSNYGQYLISYLERIEREIGYPLYALSPQNEPALGTGYNSCTYLPNEYVNMFDAVAHEFRNDGYEIKLTYADNITWGGNGWLGSVWHSFADLPVADSMGSILSMHYGGNGDVAYDEQYYGPVAAWAQGRTDRLAGNPRTVIWNTEFNGQYNSWDAQWENTEHGAAWAFITDMFMMLKSDFNAIVIWALVDVLEGRNEVDNRYSLFYIPSTTEHTFLLGPLFRLAQTVFRTVRPGMVKVEATSGNADVWTVAYQHPDQQTTTVLLMNRASTPQSVTISGSGLPGSYTMLQTSPTQNFENMGEVNAGDAVTLPVKSLTALTTVPASVSATPTIPRAKTEMHTTPVARQLTPSGNYSLLGRELGKGALKANTGLVIRRFEGGAVKRMVVQDVR